MLWLEISIAVGFVALAAALLFIRLASRFDRNTCTSQWLNEFALEDYAPMERLLDASDFRFLASQPGYRPEMRKRLRRARRKAFFEYLSLVIRDFNKLQFLGKALVVRAAEDRSELARALWNQQVKFYLAISLVSCKAALYPWFWTALDVPRLLNMLQQTWRQVREVSGYSPGTIPA